MNHDAVLRWCLRQTQDLLCEAASVDDPTFDCSLILGLRQLLSRSVARQAIWASDTFLAFVMRRVVLVIADESRTEREMIDVLLPLLLDVKLRSALYCESRPIPRG